jgi:hypothetical protein
LAGALLILALGGRDAGGRDGGLDVTDAACLKVAENGGREEAGDLATAFLTIACEMLQVGGQRRFFDVCSFPSEVVMVRMSINIESH